VRELFDSKGLRIKVGRPLSQVFSMDDESFAITPRFSPGDYFGAGVRMCDIADSPLLRAIVARKRNISSPLAALFFAESKLLL